MMRRMFVASIGIAIIGMSFGCGDSTKPSSIEVKGTVTVDGKPIPDGEISFLVAGQSPTLFPIKDGAYSGKALSGSNKIEIRAFKDGPPMTTDPEKKPTRINYLGDNYGMNSKLTADVKSGASNDFKFELTSR